MAVRAFQKDALSLAIFGAAADTGNLGVSALLHSALAAVARFAPEARVTAFDNGWGVRSAVLERTTGSFAYQLAGARLSRRYHRPESFANMRFSARFGGVGNPGMRAILKAHAVWDVSGGDSFCDLYGERRLEAILAPKRLVLDHGVPLVLLPQTYGPFRADDARAAAADIVRRSALAWARDARSFEALRLLLGDEFDPKRHRQGVDMAFALEVLPPRAGVPEPLSSWLAPERERPTVGLNVSGLIYSDPDAARKYDLRVDYRRLVDETVRALLDRTDANIVLVPHVNVDSKRIESDPEACRRVIEQAASASDGAHERLVAAPAFETPGEAKWVLARLDWFSGTRMHACIGALSRGVPTAGLAYSLKTQGVFESCGQGDHVVDLRKLETDAAIEAVWRSWEARQAAQKVLQERLPEVVSTARKQLAETLERSAGFAFGEARA